MPRNPFELAPGERFAPVPFQVSREEALAYREAVGDDAPVYRQAGAPLPPLLLAAKGLRLLMEQVDIRPGSVHGSQEGEFLRPAFAGQALRLDASVARASTRQGQRVLVLEFSVLEGDAAVCRGRATLLIPAEELA